MASWRNAPWAIGPRHMRALPGSTSLPMVMDLMPWTSNGRMLLSASALVCRLSRPSIVGSDGP